MKRLLKYSITVLSIMILLCGCGKNMKKTDVDSVIAKLKQMGVYKEEDAQTKSAGSAVRFGAYLTNRWTVNFDDYVTDKSACDTEYSLAIMTWDNMEETREANYVIAEHELEAFDRYSILVRVDNTLLMVSGPKSDKDAMTEFMTDLGYYR